MKNADKSVTLDGTLNKNVSEKLEKILGYKVDTGTQYNESYYSISW